MFSFGLDFWGWISKAGLILETYLRIVELFPFLMVETPCINCFLTLSLSYSISAFELGFSGFHMKFGSLKQV